MGSSLSVRAETSSGLSACQIVVKGLGVTLADPLVPNCLVSRSNASLQVGLCLRQAHGIGETRNLRAVYLIDVERRDREN